MKERILSLYYVSQVCTVSPKGYWVEWGKNLIDALGYISIHMDREVWIVKCKFGDKIDDCEKIRLV